MSSSAPHSTPNKAPAFQFYVYEWRASRAVQRMTFAQRGMYFEMLCEQWEKGSLPDCPRACADALGGTEDEWIAAWPTLRRKFVDRRSHPRNGIEVHDPNNHNPARQIVNLRLEQVRKARRSFVNARKNAGREGGRSKAQKDKRIEAGKTIAKPSTVVANASTEVAKPSSLLISTPLNSTLSDLISTPLSEPAAEGRSKRPMFKGQRFVVFEWMYDNLRQMLGSHFDVFDVHEWFYALDAKAEAANLVVPQRDGGKWLMDQTLAEAIRRGLPVAASSQAGSGKTAGNAASLARFAAKGKTA